METIKYGKILTQLPDYIERGNILQDELISVRATFISFLLLSLILLGLFYLYVNWKFKEEKEIIEALNKKIEINKSNISINGKMVDVLVEDNSLGLSECQEKTNSLLVEIRDIFLNP